MVGAEGFEPPMFTRWEWLYRPLQHRRRCRTPIINLVRPVGLEPTTN